MFEYYIPKYLQYSDNAYLHFTYFILYTFSFLYTLIFHVLNILHIYIFDS